MSIILIYKTSSVQILEARHWLDRIRSRQSDECDNPSERSLKSASINDKRVCVASDRVDDDENRAERRLNRHAWERDKLLLKVFKHLPSETLDAGNSPCSAHATYLIPILHRQTC